jgi:hypothetical protein
MKREIKDYTPELLAKDFLNVALLNTSSTKDLEYARERIRDNANKILEHYKKHGNLKNFPSIRVSKHVLQLILEIGVEGAREILRKQKDRGLKSQPRKGWSSTVRPRHGPRYTNSLDNAVRIIEGD